MIREKTTFVIGAGASYEFGLPLGSKLKNDIQSIMNIRFENGFHQSSGDITAKEALQRLATEQKIDRNVFFRAANKIAAAMCISASIDNFVEAHSSDPITVTCAKIAIARAILSAEAASSLKVEDSNRLLELDLSLSSNTWIVRFFQICCESLPREQITRIFDNVSLVVFNYDRCIEHYLCNALQVYYNIASDEAESIVHTLTIHRPYGSIGPLRWQERSGIAFGEQPDSRQLPECATRLRTFSEQIDDQNSLEKMRFDLRTSVNLFFMGFAFAEPNMNLLFDDQAIGATKIAATTIGLHAMTQTKVTNRLRRLGPQADLFFDQSTAANFLEAYSGIFRG